MRRPRRSGAGSTVPDEARERLADLGMALAEVDGRFEVTELAAAIVAAPVEFVRQHALLAEEARDAVGKLDLAAGPGRHRAQVVKDPRREHVAPDHRERRRRLAGLRLLDDP